MEITQLLRKVQQAGIQLYLGENGQLRFHAAKGAMTAEIKQNLRDHKADIIAFLSRYGAAQAAPVSLPRLPAGSDAPLSFAQERLWMVDQMNPGEVVYLIPKFQRIEGEFNENRLEECLRLMIQRHELLRAQVIDGPSGACWQILPSLSWSLPRVDLRDLDPPEQAAQLDALRAEMVNTPIALDRAPLWRMALWRTGERVWILAACFHHVISDDWSDKLFEAEWRAFYRDLSVGRVPAPTPLPYRYVDYAWGQRNQMDAATVDALGDWWRTRLQAVEPLDFPIDKQRPPRQTFAGDQFTFALPGDLSRAWSALAKQHGVSPFMALLTLYAELLRRFSGQETLCIGTSIGNREAEELEPLLGLFVNLVPLVIEGDGRNSFVDQVNHVRAQVLAALEKGALPFEKIVAGAAADRDLSRHPLFQTQLIYAAAPVHDDRTAQPEPFEMTELEYEGRVSRLDFSFLFSESETGFVGAVEFNTDLFLAASMHQLVQRFEQLMRAVVAAPETPLAGLSMLTADDRSFVNQRMLPRCVSKKQDTLRARFADAAARFPQRIALQYEDQSWTYAALNDAANRMAQALTKRGLGPEQRVGLYFDRSAEMVVAILAVVKAGATYLPLDPKHPRDRVRYTCEDARLALLVCDDSLRDDLVDFAGDTALLTYSDWVDAAASLPATEPAVLVLPDHPAYIIYTSGSTGRPKGCVIPHHQVTRLFDVSRPMYRFDETDTWTLFHAYTFDFSVWEMWGALLYGGRCLVVPYMVSRSPEAFQRLLCTAKVTVLNQTPSAFYQLIAVEEGLAAEQRCQSLRYVIFGGEALDFKALRPWYAMHGDQPQLINMYGITETTVHVTYRPVTAAEAEAGLPSHIGAPLDDLSLFLLDERFEPVPVGVRGEIYVGGAGLARGYFDRPALTAERFIPNPFADVPGERLYRTGDRARFLPNGELVYLGRVDHQVKIRGFRIELGEIIQVLQDHPSVRDAMVLVVEHQGHKRLAGFVVADTLSADDLRTHAAQRLPEYMVPASLRVLPRFPLTANGKVDRAALAALPMTEATDSSGQAPTTPLQKQLAELWLSVLPVETLGIHDSFFSLGGDSLLAVKMRAAARKAGLEFDMGVLFETPTIAGLAEALQAPRNETEQLLVDLWTEILPVPTVGLYDSFFSMGGDSLLAVKMRAAARKQGLHFDLSLLFDHPTIAALATAVNGGDVAAIDGNSEDQPLPFALIDAAVRAQLPQGVEDAYPMSQLQQGMIYHSQSEPDATLYHDIMTYRLTVAFDQTRLQAVLAEVAARHPILRTSFAPADYGVPLQLVWAEAQVPFTLIDWRERGNTETALHDLVTTWQNKTFAIEQAPLLHIGAVLERGQWVLVVRVHHAVIDGWSEMALFTEIMTRYTAALAGRPINKAALTCRYAAFIALEQKALQDESTRARWRELIADMPFTPLPRALPDQVTQCGQAHVRLDLDEALSQRLISWAQQAGVPLKSVLVAVHLKALAWWSGQAKATTGLIFNGRPEHAQTEEVLGLFLCPLPLSLGLDEPTWSALVQAAFRAESALMPLRHFPLAELQRLNGNQPLFEVDFNYTHFRVAEGLQEDALDEHIVERQGVAEHGSPLGVDFSRDLGDPRIYGNLSYDSRLFAAERIEQLAAAYRAMLHELAADPHADPRRWALSDAALTHAARAGSLDYQAPAVDLMTALSQQRTAATPALIYGDQTWSKADLWCHVDVLRQQIAANLANPAGAVIAVAARRGPFRVAAMLAVLAEGGCFLDLDTQLPEQRLAHMVAEAEVALILGDGGADSAALLALPRVAEPSSWPRVEPRPITRRVASPAYLIFTSGSTGLPKAVVVDDQALLVQTRSVVARYRMDRHDRVLQMNAIGFDLALEEIFSTLLAGACLVIPAGEGPLTLRDFNDLVSSQALTLLNLPTSYWQQWVADLVDAGQTVPDSLRLLIVGTEHAPLETLRTWRRHAPRVDWINAYGPTEAVITATTWLVKANDRMPTAISIGEPLGHVHLEILDEQQRPVPFGAPGELWLGGAALAQGYRNQPELTAARFQQDPNGSAAGARRYRTGDRAVLHGDGRLQLLGRQDFQIKLRGFRVELEEIERVLANQAGVAAAAVKVNETAGGQRLVGYLVAAPGATLVVGDVQEYCRGQLPPWMMPDDWLVLDAMPLTANGKTDRKALPFPNQTTPALTLPADALEQRMAAIWAEVLGHDQVDVKRHFFELGGTSLSALRLAARLERAFGRALSLAVLLAQGSIRALCAYLRNLTGNTQRLHPLAADSETAQPLLLWFAGAGGQSAVLLPLMEACREAWRCYDVDTRPAQRGESIREFAASLLDEALLQDTKQPLLLAGWSHGGLLALETARQAQARGLQVIGLVLLDTLHPNAPLNRRGDSETALFTAWLEDLRGRQNSAEIDLNGDVVWQTVPHNAAAWSRLADALQQQIGFAADGEFLAAWFQTWTAHLAAARVYQPAKRHNVPTLWLRAEESTRIMAVADDFDHTQAWTDTLGSELEAVDIDANHYSLLHDPRSAAQLRAWAGRQLEKFRCVPGPL